MKLNALRVFCAGPSRTSPCGEKRGAMALAFPCRILKRHRVLAPLRFLEMLAVSFFRAVWMSEILIPNCFL